MPLANWVVEFDGMSETAQGSAIREERYSHDELRVCCHTQSRYGLQMRLQRSCKRISHKMQVCFRVMAMVMQRVCRIFSGKARLWMQFEMKPETGDLKLETEVIQIPQMGADLKGKNLTTNYRKIAKLGWKLGGGTIFPLMRC